MGPEFAATAGDCRARCGNEALNDFKSSGLGFCDVLLDSGCRGEGMRMGDVRCRVGSEVMSAIFMDVCADIIGSSRRTS